MPSSLADKILDNTLLCVTMSYGERRKKMKPTLTIRLPEDMRSTLKQISYAEQKPVSDIVRESIRRYISVYQFRRLSDKVLPFAEAQGLLTDEDVFRALK